MTMLELDVSSITPHVVPVGHRASSVGATVPDVLSRLGVPWQWVDIDDARPRTLA